MDFVPAPTGSAPKFSLQVPFLAKQIYQYDGGGADLQYRKFPQHVGLASEDGKLDHTREREELLAFLQSWLYFGLLSALTKRSLEQSDFCCTDTRMVDSAQVADVINEFGATVSEVARGVKATKMSMKAANRFSSRHAYPSRALQPEKNAFFQSASEHLKTAAEAVYHIEEFFKDDQDETLALVSLSTKVLLSTLAQIIYGALGIHPRLDQYNPSLRPCTERDQEPDLPASRLLLRLMLSNRWCRRQANIVLCYTYNIAYFFARLPRLPRDHSNCARLEKCIGWNAFEGQQLNFHRDSGCKCGHLTVSTQEVADIIRAGGIPLVRLEQDPEGQWSLKLFRKRSFTPYIAISHVWSDGLGNPDENGLPKCQLLHLFDTFGSVVTKSLPWLTARDVSRSFVAKMLKRQNFWMDTLCIPPINPQSKDAIPDIQEVKNLAIDGMNSIYAGAVATLVLDAELRNIPRLPLNEFDLITLQAYAVCCGWTTRSWTLQESALSSNIFFALANHVYHFSQTGSKLTNKISSGTATDTIVNQIRDIFLSSQLPLRTPVHTQASAGEHDAWLFCLAWNAMLNRTSTQSASVPAILGNIVRFSASKLLQIPDAKRTPTLIRNQCLLPIDILYNTGPRVPAVKITEVNEAEANAKTTLRRWPSFWSQEESKPNVDVESIVSNFSHTTTMTIANAKNRWVPSSISGDFWTNTQQSSRQSQEDHVFGGFDNILFNKHDRLHLRKDAPRRPTILLFDHYGILEKKFVIFFSTKRCRIRILVEQVFQPGDHLIEEITAGYYCFLIDCKKWAALADGQRLRGAQLRVIEEVEEGKNTVKTFSTIYDCPLRISAIVDSPTSYPEYCAVLNHGHAINILYTPEELGPELPKLRKKPYGFTMSTLLSLTLLISFLYTANFWLLDFQFRLWDWIIPLWYSIFIYPVAKWVHGAAESKVLLMDLRGERPEKNFICGIWGMGKRKIVRMLGSFYGAFLVHVPFVAAWWIYQIRQFFILKEKFPSDP